MRANEEEEEKEDEDDAEDGRTLLDNLRDEKKAVGVGGRVGEGLLLS
jgi:hypothetical protein